MLTSVAQLKKELKNRLFFYPGDALYMMELAKTFHLKPNEYYKLYSIMGAQELENTLALYTPEDYAQKTLRINLRCHLPYILPKLPQLNTDDEKPMLVIGVLSDEPRLFKEFLTELINYPLRYRNIRIVLGTQLKTKQNNVTFTTLLYGYNPFYEPWQEYIRKNKFHPKDFASHNNALFNNRFGVFSLGAFAYDNAFVSDLVQQGLRLIETHLNHDDYDQNILPVIEHCGLLRTGGYEHGI